MIDISKVCNVARRKISNLAILRQTFVSVCQCMAHNDVAAYILARRQTAPPSQLEARWRVNPAMAGKLAL